MDPSQKQYNLDDPAQVQRTRSSNYIECYANRVEVKVTAWDVRLKFTDIVGLDEESEKIEVEEKVGLVITHEHLLRLQQVINRVADGLKTDIAKTREVLEPPK